MTNGPPLPRNEISEAAAAEPDLATALAKFEDAGEDLADRCRDDGYVYLALAIRNAMKMLAGARAHEFARLKSDRRD